MGKWELSDDHDSVVCLRVHEDTCLVLCALSVRPVKQHSRHAHVWHFLYFVLSVKGSPGVSELEVIVLVTVAIVKFLKSVANTPVCSIFDELKLHLLSLKALIDKHRSLPVIGVRHAVHLQGPRLPAVELTSDSY